MKRKLLIPFIALSAFNGFSQSVTNGGFENWTGTSITIPVIGTINFEELSGWKSSNSATVSLDGSTSVLKSTDSYAGTYSLEVRTIETQTLLGKDTVTGVLSTTFKVNNRPSALNGFYKSSLKGFKDSIGIIASAIHLDPITKLTSVIGTTGLLIDKNRPNFTEFSAPFSYTNQTLSVDSVSIIIISANAKKVNKAPQTAIWLDELTLLYPGPLSLDKELAYGNANIYPNPASGTVYISYNGNENAVAEILDENGMTVKRITQLTAASRGVDVSDLQSGVYFVKLITNSNAALSKLIIQ